MATDGFCFGNISIDFHFAFMFLKWVGSWLFIFTPSVRIYVGQNYIYFI